MGICKGEDTVHSKTVLRALKYKLINSRRPLTAPCLWEMVPGGSEDDHQPNATMGTSDPSLQEPGTESFIQSCHPTGTQLPRALRPHMGKSRPHYPEFKNEKQQKRPLNLGCLSSQLFHETAISLLHRRRCLPSCCLQTPRGGEKKRAEASSLQESVVLKRE